jgi:hypothetical protein
MIKRNILFILLFISAFILFQNNYLNAEEIPFKEANQLIDVFYENLFSTKPLSQCENIFYDVKTFAELLKKEKEGESILSDNEVVWKFLRANAELFSFQREFDPKMILQRVGRGYLFTNVPQNYLLNDAKLSIQLFARFSPDKDVDAYKEIVFPIMKDKTKKCYLIGIYGIRINGIFLNPLGKKREKLVIGVGDVVQSFKVVFCSGK